MAKQQNSENIFDVDEIASRNIEEAKLRAKAFRLALDCKVVRGRGTGKV
jgi:hypothetical protein